MRVLAVSLGSPVLDKTDENGVYDFTSRWAPAIDEARIGRWQPELSNYENHSGASSPPGTAGTGGEPRVKTTRLCNAHLRSTQLAWIPTSLCCEFGQFWLATGPAIFTALAEQLGLRLLAHKVPVEVLVIDQAEKPSTN